MKTKCKDCIFATYQDINLLVDPPIKAKSQSGCKADMLKNFKYTVSQEEEKSFYLLEGFCNLCTAPSRANQLNIKTVEDAKKIVKINPLAVMIVDESCQLSESVKQLKDKGFENVCFCFSKTEVPISFLNELGVFKEYKITKFEKDESDDFMVDESVKNAKCFSYCVFKVGKEIPDIVEFLNKKINEESKVVLMVTENQKQKYDKIHGFWCQKKLHMYNNGNMPDEDGCCLEEKIYEKAKEQKQTSYIYRRNDNGYNCE